MQISLKWINELVDLEPLNLNDLIEKLTLGGFEVEEILEIPIEHQKEIAFDLSATANRSDSLSIQGISTEIAGLVNQSISISHYSIPCQNWKESILKNVTPLQKDQECGIFCSIILKNLTDRSVPKWIKEKLLCSGILPSNNLLDFQNYILLETGYPFAFYDFEKLQSKVKNLPFSLSISKAKTNQEFRAGNGNTYSLDDSILLIQANEIPISIAGLIEHQEFAYSDSTTSFLVEGSIFNAAKIRQQSRKLGVRTDRSTRYEKSLKATYLIESFYRFISLLRIANPDLRCELHTIQKMSEERQKPILLRYQKIGEILGPIQESSSGQFEYISPQTIENYLTRLNFEFIYDAMNEVWKVSIPDSRSEDVTREIDLIEEIGRFHGFNNFLIHLPKLKTIGTEDKSYQTRKKITSCFLNLGLNEFIHYSLVNDKIGVPNRIQLINPLASDYSNLRESLLPNLIQTIQHNFKQGNSVINGFEYGHIFLPNSKQKFQEEEYVAGILGGFQTKLNWSDSERVFTWFEAKGKIEQFFHQLNIAIEWKLLSISNGNPLFHPYRTAEVYFRNGKKVGIFGQIHPILANQFHIPAELYLFEFQMERIQKEMQLNPLPIYQEYSFYPKIVKDLSFIISEKITYGELKKTFYANGTKFLSEIHLIDEYRGPTIPENQISLCFQFVFQSTEKTLQNKEIEEIVNHLAFILVQKFTATLRN